MNAMNLISIALLYFKMNMGQSAQAKVILKEGMDVMNVMTSAMKDKKITMAEKKLLVKELKEFSKAAITMLDEIQIAE